MKEPEQQAIILEKLIDDNKFEQALKMLDSDINLLPYQKDYYNAEIGFKKKDFINGKKLLKTVLIECKKNNDKFFEIKSSILLANITFFEGEYNVSLDLIKVAEIFVEKNFSNDSIQKISLQEKLYDIKGECYWNIKMVKEAIETKFKAIEFEKKLGKENRLARNLNRVGNMYSLLGQLEKAHDSYQESLKLSKQNNYKGLEVRALTNLGYEIYFKNSMYDKALDMLKEGEKIGREINEQYPIISLLYAIGYVYLSQGSLAEFNEYYKKLEVKKQELEKTNAGEYAEILRKLLEALYLKSKKRMREKSLSQEKLKTLVNEKNFQFDIQVIAYYNLIDILIDEYSLYEEKEVINEIYTYTNQLLEFGVKEKAYNIILELSLLKVKLQMVEKNIPDALETLSDAKEILETNNLKYMEEKIKSAKDELNEFIKELDEHSKKNVKANDELEKIQMKRYLQEAKKLLNIEVQGNNDQ